MRVVVNTDHESELYFRGNEEDSKIIYDTLCEYHKYNCCVLVALHYDDDEPKYSAVSEFMDVYEYCTTYDGIRSDI